MSEIHRHYEKLRTIGSGAFGTIWLARSVKSNKKYIIKEIRASIMDSAARAQSLNEVRILRDLAHPYIVRYRTAFVHDGTLSICMEYAAGGDMHALIRKQKGAYIDESTVLRWFTQLTLAVDYIHSYRILHRDIKTSNIFLTTDLSTIKLGDFGIAKVLEATNAHADTMIGTPYYLSPEICEGQAYNAKSDIWALGCCLYEMCSLAYPFNSTTMRGLIAQIITAKVQPLPSQYQPQLTDLVRSLLAPNPAMRPNTEGVLESPVLRTHVISAITALRESDKRSSRRDLAPTNAPTGRTYIVPKSSLSPSLVHPIIILPDPSESVHTQIEAIYEKLESIDRGLVSAVRDGLDCDPAALVAGLKSEKGLDQGAAMLVERLVALHRSCLTTDC